MLKTPPIKTIIIVFMILTVRMTMGQMRLENAWTVGDNNVSSGAYLRTALGGYYMLDNYSFDSHIQIDIINPQQRVLSGFLLAGSRDSIFQKFPINISAQYLLNPFSETLRESNFSFIASKSTKGFSYALGINFKTFAFTKQAAEDYNIEERRYHENWGLLYSLGYTYRPKQYDWDISLVFTNWDTFLINQDMNPYLRLIGQYHFDKIKLFTEANYIKSGVFNGSSNYFGYYINTGIIWYVN